jgi:hypothetical protein
VARTAVQLSQVIDHLGKTFRAMVELTVYGQSDHRKKMDRERDAFVLDEHRTIESTGLTTSKGSRLIGKQDL